MPHLKDADTTSATKLSIEKDAGTVAGSSMTEEVSGAARSMKRHFEEKKEEDTSKPPPSQNGSGYGRGRPGSYPGQVTPSPYADGRMYPPYPSGSHPGHHQHWHRASSSAAAAASAPRTHPSSPAAQHFPVAKPASGLGATGARKLFPTSPIRTGIFRGKEKTQFEISEGQSKSDSKPQTDASSSKTSTDTKSKSAVEKRNASEQDPQRLSKDMRDKPNYNSSLNIQQQQKHPDYPPHPMHGNPHSYHHYEYYQGRGPPPGPSPFHHHPYYAAHPYEHYPPPPSHLPQHSYENENPSSHPQFRKRPAPEESPPYSPVTSRSKKSKDPSTADSLATAETNKATTQKADQADTSKSESKEQEDIPVRQPVEEEDSVDAKNRQRVISPSSSGEAGQDSTTAPSVASKRSAEPAIHTEPPRIKRLHGGPPSSAPKGPYHPHPHSAPPPPLHYPPYSGYLPYPVHPHDACPPPPPGYYSYPPGHHYPPTSGYPPSYLPHHHHHGPPPPPGYPGMPMYPGPPPPHHGHPKSPIHRYYPPGTSPHPPPPGSASSATTAHHTGAYLDEAAQSPSESKTNHKVLPTNAATPPETKKALASTASALLKKEEEDKKSTTASTAPSPTKSAESKNPSKSAAQQQQQNQIQSVKEWQEATLATGKAPSANRCVALTGPIPTKFWGEAEKTKDEPIPDFHRLVNYPDYMIKSRTQQSNNNAETLAAHQTKSNKRYCVMCGKARLSSASAASSAAVRSRSARKSQDDASSSSANNPDFDSEDKTLVIIPRQNKGLCTACDVSVWVIRGIGTEIKWCKGCKNFRPWAAFGDKGLATKCARCRDRQREKYAMQKDELKLRRLQQEKNMMIAEGGSPTSCISQPAQEASVRNKGSVRKQRQHFSSASGEEKKDDDDDKDCHHQRDLAAAQGLHSLLAAASTKITKS